MTAGHIADRSCPSWRPTDGQRKAANLNAFMKDASRRFGRTMDDYPSLHQWSVGQPEEFWSFLWDWAGVVGIKGGVMDIKRDCVPGSRWFEKGRLNYAENLLTRCDDGAALIAVGEDGVMVRLSWRELQEEVSRVVAALRREGVKAGDRVAGMMPNIAETVVAMLATTSMGAIWSSCSPDFGVAGVLDRFGQVEPTVLFVANGYWYGGEWIDVIDKAVAVAGGLPGLRRLVVVAFPGSSAFKSVNPREVDYASWKAAAATSLSFERYAFDHPLFIMFSSGTTGVPKCIVHGAGGTLLQHIKEQRLHTDLKPGDRLFYYTTCGWMMWNWLMSGLASGATLVLYDGSPFAKRGQVLWELAEAERITHFGTSAKYLDHLARLDIKPGATRDLDPMRALLSTGSPLAAETFDYVYGAIKADLCLSSISGGTDILGCFVLGNPMLPVWRGELQCLGLGMDVDVVDESGNSVRGGKGELVCRRPFPSMPVGFWNDSTGQRYRAAYFERFPGVWHHGDYGEMTEHEGVLGMIIHGRSDATLNPGGVRIGTAEIYRQVERVEGVMESLVIAQEWEKDVRVVLFVKLRKGVVLDASLMSTIKDEIRRNTTPRHVPAKIVEVADIPRTRSGKIVELAVRNVVHNRPVENREALANPEALENYRNRPELMF